MPASALSTSCRCFLIDYVPSASWRYSPICDNTRIRILGEYVTNVPVQPFVITSPAAEHILSANWRPQFRGILLAPRASLTLPTVSKRHMLCSWQRAGLCDDRSAGHVSSSKRGTDALVRGVQHTFPSPPGCYLPSLTRSFPFSSGIDDIAECSSGSSPLFYDVLASLFAAHRATAIWPS